jgi:hypothetical protein
MMMDSKKTATIDDLHLVAGVEAELHQLNELEHVDRPTEGEIMIGVHQNQTDSQSLSSSEVHHSLVNKQ